jgi:hypothetical protein
MVVKDPKGNTHEAILSTAHSQNPSGQAVVLVVNGQVCGTFEVTGWEIVQATSQERIALASAGYFIRK